MIEESVFVLGGSVVLVLAGVASIAATRNLLKVVMGIQAVLLGALLPLSLATQGQASAVILIPAVAAAAAEAVGMAVLALVWEKYRTTDPHQVSELRW